VGSGAVDLKLIFTIMKNALGESDHVLRREAKSAKFRKLRQKSKLAFNAG
jgi:hypothetical protein